MWVFFFPLSGFPEGSGDHSFPEGVCVARVLWEGNLTIAFRELLYLNCKILPYGHPIEVHVAFHSYIDLKENAP